MRQSTGSRTAPGWQNRCFGQTDVVQGHGLI
jgi:hypothetical protein